jgi:hypothetical protein
LPVEAGLTFVTAPGSDEKDEFFGQAALFGSVGVILKRVRDGLQVRDFHKLAPMLLAFGQIVQVPCHDKGEKALPQPTAKSFRRASKSFVSKIVVSKRD